MADDQIPGPDGMRPLAAAIGDRANVLAAEGRVAEVPALWEQAIAELPDERSQALLTLAYAWYQALHGEVEHGVRLAAGLRECQVSQVRGQVRVLVRNRARVEPEAVEGTWRAVTGSALPEWAAVADEDIDLVAEWVVAASWQESEALFGANISRITSQAIEAALEEMVLGDPRARSTIAVHRAVVALGGDVGYRSVHDAREAARMAAAAIAARDWEALRACGAIERTVHGRVFLGGLHGGTADLMSGGSTMVSPEMVARVGELAEDAEPWERRQAVADLTAVGDPSLRPLVETIEESLGR